MATGSRAPMDPGPGLVVRAEWMDHLADPLALTTVERRMPAARRKATNLMPRPEETHLLEARWALVAG